jgi:hypothetical protein
MTVGKIDEAVSVEIVYGDSGATHDRDWHPLDPGEVPELMAIATLHQR